MTLHENKSTFEAAVKITAEHFGIPEVMVEKDYWVTFALKQLFTNEAVKDAIVFKGGTALSKCYRLIERFSEDIDLVMIIDDEMSGAAIKVLLKKITSSVSEPLISIDKHPLENKKGKLRKVAFGYQKVDVSGSLGQVRDEIIVEVSALGSPYPCETFEVYSLIARYIGQTENLQLIQQFELTPFPVKVLGLTRTFCEKIISLVRFSYTNDPLQSLADKVRHTYDLHFLLQEQSIKQFLKSKDFEVMLLQVGLDDDKAIPNDKEWLYNHPSKALIFSELEATWKQLSITYNGIFKELTYGNPPEAEEILVSLMLIKERLKSASWSIAK
ncbi:nucleotidyl transferase AbiEii/AbiGii toxin family protein [Aquimarina agarilytica]|uniref:nucleotidyl transferase AbiEii/AbiGii toxin family protein n=1 Tax=Aquimarina agarilytica TaxID=1087449 RepID=UPI000287C6F0|nr:nucleotidyl transferase AbiEii/AbiGii toxin family protein [Aquimarina agarilytica]